MENFTGGLQTRGCITEMQQRGKEENSSEQFMFYLLLRLSVKTFLSSCRSQITLDFSFRD